MAAKTVSAVTITDEGDAVRGGKQRLVRFAVDIDFGNIVTQTAALNAVAGITGLAVGDQPIAIFPSEAFASALMFQAVGPVTVAGTLQVRVSNPTVGDINPAVDTFQIFVLRG